MNDVGGIMHCFSGDVEIARRCLDLGLLISLATDRALERARLLAARPPAAYAENKRRVRADALARFDATRRTDPFLEHWFDEESQRRVAALVVKLAEKR